ncbi:MAG: tol-pal system YbgF family protein, partial [Nitrospinota bacterium]
VKTLGDIYRAKGKYRESIKLYTFVVNNYPGDAAFNSSLVRLADMGREKQGLVENGEIFDYSAYEQPQKVYSEMLKKSPESDAGRDSLFGSGKVFKNGKQYLKAIEKFEEFLAKYSEEELAAKSKVELREIFFELVDKYHAQEGFFQVLLTYYRNFEQFFSELKEPELLFEIGNSYRELGLYNKAISMFTSASTFDKKGKWSEAVLMGTCEALLGLNRVTEAQKGLKKLLGKYKNGKYVQNARMLLSESLMEQKRYGEAVSQLSQYLKKYKTGTGRIKAFYLIGLAQEERKRYKDAVKQYQNAIGQIDRSSESAALKEQKANIQFKIARALFKGKEYKKVITHIEILKKGYIADSRLQWARYLEAESYRRLKESEKSKGILSMLAGVDDKLVRSVAVVEAEYLTWKEEHPDLFTKKKGAGAKTGKK